MTVTPWPATMSTETDEMPMAMPERKDDRSCVVGSVASHGGVGIGVSFPDTT
jgi:hypothetical protein